jgi:hypothetical protein
MNAKRVMLKLIPAAALAVSAASAWQGCANRCSDDASYPGCVTNVGGTNNYWCTSGASYCDLGEVTLLCMLCG